MSSGTVYLIIAGIVLIVAIVVMMVWTALHMRGTESGAITAMPRQSKRNNGERRATVEATPMEAIPDPDDDLDQVKGATVDEVDEVLYDASDHEEDSKIERDHVTTEESEQINDPDDGIESFAKLLGRMLQIEDVLGWLTVFPDGRRGLRAQEYDEMVIDLFATLAEQVKYTADVVGLEHAKEFVVRGEEGTIMLFPAAFLDAKREDFVVLFMQADVVGATRIAEQLLRTHL